MTKYRILQLSEKYFRVQYSFLFMWENLILLNSLEAAKEQVDHLRLQDGTKPLKKSAYPKVIKY